MLVLRSLAFKRGGREGARKVMIVVTDGESHDSPDLQQAVEDSEKDNITLYAIAVSVLIKPYSYAIAVGVMIKPYSTPFL